MANAYQQYTATADPSDPYNEWRGGTYITRGYSYQDTPQWQEQYGPFSIGPFSGMPTPAQSDLARYDAPVLYNTIDPFSIDNQQRYDNGDLYAAYAAQFGAVSAPVLPTDAASLAGTGSGSTAPANKKC